MSKVTTFFLGWTDLWNWVGILGQAQPARVPRLRVGNSCAWFHSSSRFWQYFVLLPSWFWPVCSADPGAEHKEHTARLSLLGSPRSPEKKGIWHPSGHLGTWDRGHWNAGGRTSVLSRKPCPGKVQTMSDTTVFPICAMSQNPIQITLKQFHQGSLLEMSLQSISSEEKWHVPVQKCAILASCSVWSLSELELWMTAASFSSWGNYYEKHYKCICRPRSLFKLWPVPFREGHWFWQCRNYLLPKNFLKVCFSKATCSKRILKFSVFDPNSLRINDQFLHQISKE